MRNIRQAKETDLDRIREIISSAIGECVANSDEDHEFLYADVCSSLDWWVENKERSVFLVCDDGDVISGFVLVKEYSNLSALFVDPEHQRSEIGRELVTRAIELCKGRSPGACLTLNSSNHAAAFYRKMGFTQIASGIDRPGGCVPFEYKF